MKNVLSPALGAVLLLACSNSSGGPSQGSGGAAGRGGGTGANAGGPIGGNGGSTSTGGRSSTGGSSGATSGGAPGGKGGSASNGGASGSGGAGTGGTLLADASAGDVGGPHVGGNVGGDAGSDVGGPNEGIYYVSPAGSDSNPGTIDAPFQTITKARDVIRTVNSSMAHDIHVYLRGGDYRITDTIAFGPQDSGTGGHTIYYQAYAGETPVLNGSTKVTGWTQSTGGLWQAPLKRSSKLRNLYVDDARAYMASKKANSRGGYNTYSVTAGQADWAWVSGSGSDGIAYSTSDVPVIASNTDDLEISNYTMWNENIVTTRGVTASNGNTVLLLQQPYGVIAQTPNWGAGFNVNGTHTIYNAFEFLKSPGQFFFDKTAGTLYYYPLAGQNMATVVVEVPFVSTLVSVQGTSTTKQVANITFQGITFANTDYGLYDVAGSHGKATAQGSTVYIAYGDGNYHKSAYQIADTLPGMINVNSAKSINFIGNVIKHSGSEGVMMTNDVSDSELLGNLIYDIAGSSIVISHPQHVYIGAVPNGCVSGASHLKYAPGVAGVCSKVVIKDNFIYQPTTMFQGHSGIAAFFPDTLTVTHNVIDHTSWNGLSMGWGWWNFNGDPDSQCPGKPSTTAKNNTVTYNQFIDVVEVLSDTGAMYTVGAQPDTTMSNNYTKGTPGGQGKYGLHHDEGSAYITAENNVMDIDLNVENTIEVGTWGRQHDMTYNNNYGTKGTYEKTAGQVPNIKMPPINTFPDAVWPLDAYSTCIKAGLEAEYQHIIPTSAIGLQDIVFPASVTVSAGSSLPIKAAGDASASVWFAPNGTKTFAEGPTMTKVAGTSTSIKVPATKGSYRLYVVSSDGSTSAASASTLVAS
jgi:hypothetical protein